MASTTSKVVEGYLEILFGPDDMLFGKFIDEDAPPLQETVEDLLSTLRIPVTHQLVPLMDPKTPEQKVMAALYLWALYNQLPVSELKTHCWQQGRRWLSL